MASSHWARVSFFALTALAGCGEAAGTEDNVPPPQEANLTDAELHYDQHLTGKYLADTRRDVVNSVELFVDQEGAMTGAFFRDECTFTFAGKISGGAATIRAVDGRTEASVSGSLSRLEEGMNVYQYEVARFRIKLVGGELNACKGAAKKALYEGIDLTNAAEMSTRDSIGFRTVAKRTPMLQYRTKEELRFVNGSTVYLEPGDVVRVMLMPPADQPDGMVPVGLTRWWPSPDDEDKQGFVHTEALVSPL